MIAFDYDDETGAVTGRRLRGVGVDALGEPGVLVVAHLSKLGGLDVSNVVDLADLDLDALTAPLWQLSVAGGAVTVDPLASPPEPPPPAAALTDRQVNEIHALINDELNNHGLLAVPNQPAEGEPVP